MSQPQVHSVLSPWSIAFATVTLIGGMVFATITQERRDTNELAVASGGLLLEDIDKMKSECEMALPRNEYCEMTFTPSEVFNGRMVEDKSPGRTD